MEKVDWMLLEGPGISELSPEQTVAMLVSFMEDAGVEQTAKAAGVSRAVARRCTRDIWNVFSFRKQEMNRVSWSS
ncbi:MAG: hypothetical protein IJ225_12440 [Solobacterium sp.]|nr:hypothetical protein [Solobacterium sp.]